MFIWEFSWFLLSKRSFQISFFSYSKLLSVWKELCASIRITGLSNQFFRILDIVRCLFFWIRQKTFSGEDREIFWIFSELIKRIQKRILSIKIIIDEEEENFCGDFLPKKMRKILKKHFFLFDAILDKKIRQSLVN